MCQFRKRQPQHTTFPAPETGSWYGRAVAPSRPPATTLPITWLFRFVDHFYGLLLYFLCDFLQFRVGRKHSQQRLGPNHSDLCLATLVVHRNAARQRHI